MPSARSVRLPLAPVFLLLIAGGTMAQAGWRAEPQFSGRSNAALVHDSLRGVTYLFGGARANSSDPTIWRLEGDVWRVAGSMPMGATVQAVFDPQRDRFFLLFPSGLFTSWDRSTWTTLSFLPPTGPTRHQLVRDPQRQVLTVISTDPNFTHVHEWNGTAWIARPSTGPAPPWNFNGRIAFEPATGNTLSLMAPLPGAGTSLLLWAWNGIGWQQRTTATAIPPLQWFDVGRDPLSGDLLVWGGYEAVNGFAVASDRMFAYDGTDWRAVPNMPAPSARSEHGLSNDTTRGRLLMFGGRDVVNGQTVWPVDTWAWDGSAWTRLPTTLPAPGINTAGAIYDRNAGELLVYPVDAQRTAQTYDGVRWRSWPCVGICPLDPVYLVGENGIGAPLAIAANGVFLWSAGSWLSIGAALPALPTDAAVAWDGQQVILFGGLLGSTATNQTWSWRGGTWSLLSPANSPPARAGHQMTGWPSHNGVLLPDLSGTWWWNGVDWQNVAAMPFIRHTSAAVAWLPERDRVLLHGGVDLANPFPVPIAGAWEWDGAAWVVAPSSPVPVANHLLVEASGQRLLVLDRTGIASNPFPFSYGSIAPGLAAPYGTACAGSSGPPSLETDPWQRPHLGAAFTMRVERVPHTGAFLAMGFRDDRWGASTLPLDLGIAGMPGCTALLEPEVVRLVIAAAGVADCTIAVPAQTSLLGVQWFAQAVVLDPLANPAGLTTSNGLRLRVGRR